MRKSSLATRLSVFILTGVAAVFLAALSYNYYDSKQTILKELADDAKNTTLATAYEINTLLQGVEKVPQTLATFLEQKNLSQEDLFSFIRQTLKKNPEIFGVAIAFDAFAYNPSRYYFSLYGFRDGKQIRTCFLGNSSYHYFTMDWFQIPKETAGPHWVEPYYDEGGGNIIMSTFSVPFYRQDKEGRRFGGIVTADLSLDWLRQVVAKVKIYQTGYAFLISQNGVFVTFPDKRYIMRESIFSLAESEKDAPLRDLGRKMIKGQQGFVPVTGFLSGKKAWLYYAPLGNTGWSLGVVFPEDELLAGLRTLSQKLILIGLGGVLLLGLVITLVARTATRPLRLLSSTTAEIAQGDFTVRVPVAGPREIAELAGSFNKMGDELIDYIAKRDYIRDTFGRYVTQEVVKRLLESKEALALGGETREVTILMSDLRGFTALSADMEPEEVIAFLNRYLAKMIAILMDYQAIIDEIQGDGILAFFGAPEHQPDHPVRAVACALAMQAAMEEVNTENAREGFPHLEMGIGVGSGAVVVGNIGSELRTKYSVVGSPVNFTSRIESLATAGQVLISTPTYLKVKDLTETGEVLQVRMKGVPGLVTLYEVRGLGAPYNLRLKERQETLVALAQRLPVHLDRIREKVVVATLTTAWLTHLSDTRAQVLFDGELAEWEDVRLHLLDAAGQQIPGRIYGKVTALDLQQANVRFTSVAPEARENIHRATGEA